jgi:hypothetical protein
LRQAAKAEQRALQERHNTILRGIDLAIEHKVIPGDEATLAEIVAVMQDPRFQYHPTDHLDKLKRADLPPKKWTGLSCF